MKKTTCTICNKQFEKERKNHKVCSAACKTERSRLRTQEYRRRKAEREGRLDRVDIGKGGGQPKGKNSPYFKTGIADFHKNLSYQVKREMRYCERCNKDLLDVDRYGWCAHHRDHDRTNNVRENLELVCKRCHQIEHKCWEAFNV